MYRESNYVRYQQECSVSSTNTSSHGCRGEANNPAWIHQCLIKTWLFPPIN